MEYSRAVATGLNYLETRYGIEAIPVEHKDGIRFEGRNSHAPIVIFSRSKLDSDDFIVSFRDLNSLVINEEIKFENVNRLNRRIARTQTGLDSRYGLLTKYSTTEGVCGDEVVISDLYTGLPLAKIIVLDSQTCRYSDPLYFPENIRKAKMVKEKKQRKKFNIQGLGSKILEGVLFFGAKRAIADRVEHRQSVDDANDLLLYSWADYVIRNVELDIEKSEFFSDADYDYLYGAYYVPIVSSYYNYLEQLDSDVPREYSLTSQYHGDFKNMARALNSDLNTHSYFRRYAFDKSPYSYGIVLDNYGKIIEEPVLAADGYKLPNGIIKGNALAGELYDDDGMLIRANEGNKYDVLIPVSEVVLTEKPEVTRNIDGVTYISDTLIKKNSRTK